MRQSNIFKGSGVALVTPFQSDGEIDFVAFDRLLSEQLQSDTDFICLLGTTAETPCLSLEEKRRLIRRTVGMVDGHKPILLGCGGNNTADVAGFIKNENLTGIQGLLVVTPYYNKPRQEGLFAHYKTVCEATDLPVVLYNVPGRCGVNMEAETVVRIAEACGNAVAVKEASGNIQQIKQIIASAPEGFDVLGGDDFLAFDLMQIGASGVISVTGNAFPNEFAEMVHALRDGRLESAERIHQSLQPLYPLLMVDGNPSGIKAVLYKLHRLSNVLRLPLVPVSDRTLEKVEKVLDDMVI